MHALLTAGSSSSATQASIHSLLAASLHAKVVIASQGHSMVNMLTLPSCFFPTYQAKNLSVRVGLLSYEVSRGCQVKSGVCIQVAVRSGWGGWRLAGWGGASPWGRTCSGGATGPWGAAPAAGGCMLRSRRAPSGAGTKVISATKHLTCHRSPVKQVACELDLPNPWL